MNLLNKLVLIVLVFVLSTPKDVIYALSEIPVYIDHFHHHSQGEEQISLLTFIYEHASTKNHDKKDHQDHDNLPFCHHHSSDCNQLLTFVIGSTFQKINFYLPPSSNLETIFKYFFRSSDYSPSIWQPPKM